MKVILMGNAGAGKTTLARNIVRTRSAARLSLDEVAFDTGSERRPLARSAADAVSFIERHDSWIIEGCYADIIQPLLVYCEGLVFLNPGVKTCLEHCRMRPWEKQKFESPEEQQANLANLLAWVGRYETRTDEYGLSQHRRLFDSFRGKKLELKEAAPNAADMVLRL